MQYRRTIRSITSVRPEAMDKEKEMIVGLYAVFDRASGVYDGPFPQRADGEAIRNFVNMAKNPDSAVGKNPDDFTLMKIGMFNDGTGDIEKLNPSKLINGVEATSENVVNLENANAS